MCVNAYGCTSHKICLYIEHCVQSLVVLKEVQDSMSFTMSQYILQLLLAIVDPALECNT